MIGLVWSIKEFSKEGLADIIPWVVIVLAITMIVIFVKRNLSSSDPMLDVRLLKEIIFTVQFFAFMTMFAMASVLLLASQWLQVVEELSPFKVGLYLLPMAIGDMVFAPIARISGAIWTENSVTFRNWNCDHWHVYYVFLWSSIIIFYNGFSINFSWSGMASLAVASALIMIETPTSKAGKFALLKSLCMTLEMFWCSSTWYIFYALSCILDISSFHQKV